MKHSVLPQLPLPGPDPGAWTEAGLEIARDALREQRHREMWLSWCRLGSFVLALVGFFGFWDSVPVLAGVSLAVGFALFGVARRFHRRARAQVDLHAKLQTVLEETTRRQGGAPVVIRSNRRPEDAPAVGATPLWDPGQRWPLSAQEIEDLDFYAEPIGLFGLLNRTSSHLGASRLARTIEEPLLEVDAIGERQAAVRELLERPDQRVLLLAAAAGLRDQDAELDLLAETVRDATPLPRVVSHPMLRIASFLTMAAAAALMAWQPGAWLVVLVALALVNTPVLLRYRRDLLERIRPWLRLDVVTRQLATLADTAWEILPAQDKGQLGALHHAFERARIPPALPALARRIPYLFLGLAGMLHTLVNALTLWDVHWLCALERSYLNHRAELLASIEAVAELEVLLSLATFAWEQPVACLPEVRADGDGLTIQAGYHPLIPPGEVVANDVALVEPLRLWIITGSNMSGKSTFLRTTGLCAVLAQVGCAVPARAMRLRPAAILTDLRVRDDLGRHESYFLAEVRQVKRVLDRSSRGEALLGLIDEPFRGTNSEERLGAATAVIEALIRGTGIFLVATHDRQVTQLADGKVASNHHFQETLTEDTLAFDYRIRSGPATVRNAIKVLAAENYPPEVVAQAERIVRALERGES